MYRYADDADKYEDLYDSAVKQGNNDLAKKYASKYNDAFNKSLDAAFSYAETHGEKILQKIKTLIK